MSRMIALAIPLVLVAAAQAGELRGRPSGFQLGPLAGERYRQPDEARIKVDRARRALSGDTSLDAFRAEHELDEIERDAARAARGPGRRLGRGMPDRGLLDAGKDLLPYPRSLRDREPVYGTAKAWARVGSLLHGAETAAGAGDVERARSLLGRARGTLERLSEAPPAARDPQVVATRSRIEALERRLAAGS